MHRLTTPNFNQCAVCFLASTLTLSPSACLARYHATDLVAPQLDKLLTLHVPTHQTTPPNRETTHTQRRPRNVVRPNSFLLFDSCLAWRFERGKV